MTATTNLIRESKVSALRDFADKLDSRFMGTHEWTTDDIVALLRAEATLIDDQKNIVPVELDPTPWLDRPGRTARQAWREDYKGSRDFAPAARYEQDPSKYPASQRPATGSPYTPTARPVLDPQPWVDPFNEHDRSPHPSKVHGLLVFRPRPGFDSRRAQYIDHSK